MKPALRVFFLLSRLFLAAVFLIAAVGKIRNPEAFALAVYRYRLLPSPAINAFALFLPWTELVAGLVLLLPGLRWNRVGTALVVGMMAAFTAAYAIALARGLSIACGCFDVGADAAAGGRYALARNAVLLAFSLLVFAEAFFRRPDPDPATAPAPPETP